MTQPILIQKTGKESGDRWILTGFWDGKQNWTGHWDYHFKLDGLQYKMQIPYMFDKLDGASVPRLLRSLLKMGGRDMPDEAWIPHDFVYSHKGHMPFKSLQFLDNGEWCDVMYVTKDFGDKMMVSEIENDKHGVSEFKIPIVRWGLYLAFWKKW